MYYKIIVLMILLGLSTLTSGCTGAKETDEIAFVIAMGIDKADQNNLKVTYRIMIPRSTGGLQGPGQEVPEGPTVIQSIVAPNTAEALNILNSTISRRPNLTHMKGLIIGEELARSGISQVLVPFVRFREYRGNIFIFVAKGTAEELLIRNKPKLDYLPTRWIETYMTTANESSYYTRIDVHDFYMRLKNPGGSPYANYLGVNPTAAGTQPLDGKVSQQQAGAYLPGEIPRTGTDNPIDFIGAAVFSGDKMVGALTGKQVRVLSILQNKLAKGYFILVDPLEPKSQINLCLRNGAKPDIDVDLVDGREIIKIDVFLEGEIVGIQSNINYEKDGYREMVEEGASDLVTREIRDFVGYTQELGSDVFDFGKYLRRHFDTYGEFEQADLPGMYKNAKVEVRVKTKIRRMGLMWRSSPAYNAE